MRTTCAEGHGERMALTLTPRPVRTDRLKAARAGAAAAAGLLLVGGIVALMSDPVTLADHSQGAGALSELTTGLAFVAGALALAALTPVRGWRRVLWMLAPFGLAVGGLTMVGVPIVGAEPPGWLFLLAVAPILVGMIAAGVIGTRRVWPWWTGVGVALFLPIMFAMPLNSLFMSGVWACVALTVREHVSPARGTGGPGEV